MWWRDEKQFGKVSITYWQTRIYEIQSSVDTDTRVRWEASSPLLSPWTRTRISNIFKPRTKTRTRVSTEQWCNLSNYKILKLKSDFLIIYRIICWRRIGWFLLGQVWKKNYNNDICIFQRCVLVVASVYARLYSFCCHSNTRPGRKSSSLFDLRLLLMRGGWTIWSKGKMLNMLGRQNWQQWQCHDDLIKYLFNKNKTTGMIPNFTFTLGYVFDSLLSYLLPDWRDFTLALSILAFPFVLLWPLWPKSPRWLFSVGRAKEGQEVVKLFAKFGSTYSMLHTHFIHINY